MGEARPGASVGAVVGRAGSWGLAAGPRVSSTGVGLLVGGASSWHSWLRGPGCPKACSGLLVCEAMAQPVPGLVSKAFPEARSVSLMMEGQGPAGLRARYGQLVGGLGVQAEAGLLVGRFKIQPVPGQDLPWWWVGWVHRLWGCVYLAVGICLLVVRLVWSLEQASWWAGPVILGPMPAHPEVKLCPGVSGCRTLWVPGIVPIHWCVVSGPWPSGGCLGVAVVSGVLRQPVWLWVGLCHHPVICLAWGIPVLVPPGYWAGVDLDPEANKLEGGFQNSSCQQQCPHGRMSSPKWLLPVSVSSG